MSGSGVPFSQEQRQRYLTRLYGVAAFRYWNHLPPRIRDGFTWSESNPIFSYGEFLKAAERRVERLIGQNASRREIMDSLRGLAREIWAGSRPPEEDVSRLMPSEGIDRYFGLVVNRLRAESQDREFSNTLLDNYLAAAAREHPGVAISRPGLSTPEELSRFQAAHGNTAHGNGVFMGEYGVASSHAGAPVIATDFLQDCVAVVLTATNPNDPTQRLAVLGHIDSSTDAGRAVSRMLSEIPQGYTINAALLGSASNDNAFMNTELAHALVSSGRISSLAVNVDGPTTVAVHAPTGTILTANVPKEDGDGYGIGPELPVAVKFDNGRYSANSSSYRDRHYSALFRLKPDSPPYVPASHIARAVHPTEPTELMPNPDRTLKRLTEDGVLDHNDLQTLAREVGDQMRRSGVQISVSDGPFSAIEARFPEGDKVQLGYIPNGVRVELDRPEVQDGTEGRPRANSGQAPGR